MTEPVIAVRGLRKSYDDLEAVRGIDLEVAQGEVFAFLGPNGAGKTTTVEILEGYRDRTGGDVEVLGEDPQTAGRDWRQRIGVVLQQTKMHPELTIRETLELFAGYYAAPRGVRDTISLVDLNDKAETRVGKLSGGQQRRLDVAMALVGDPELLFLDEPTTGFDPSARRQAWKVIESLRDLGKTVFLTTHYMDEAQVLADRAAIIVGGQIVAEGPPDQIGGEAATTEIRFRLPDGVDRADLPVQVHDDGGVERAVTVRTADPVSVLNDLTGWAKARGSDLPGLAVGTPSLEEVYLELTAADKDGGEAEISGLALAVHQFRFDQKTFWRNPASVFFTVMLPVIFLLIFATIFGNDTIPELGGVKTTTYYVPAIITLGVVSATAQSLAINLTIDRENGILKRTRSTPLPGWVFIAGRIGNSIVVSVISLIVLSVLGLVVYGVDIPWDHLPAVFTTLLIGAASFCCLGIALTAAIPSEDAAAPIANFALLPLYFLSGVFIPESEIPDGVLTFADIFPIRHFFEAFFTAWDPATTGSGFAWGDLGIVAAWGVAFLVIALKTFRWTPRHT